MIEFFWRLLAAFLSRPAVAAWLIQRAQRTPYFHIMSADGNEMYMGRWWLFNPYDRDTNKARKWWCPWSIRIHHIMRADEDRDLHDHPWNARTIILRGWYVEDRLVQGEVSVFQRPFVRRPGDTAALRFGEYHRIDQVSAGGVFTLFISGPYQGTWGFLVNGRKIPWRKYLGLEAGQDLPQPEKQP